MAIRITGLNSGLDTESIISALVSSYNYKVQKYQKAQTKLSWKQDAWKSLNTKVYSFYTSISSLRLSSGYNLKSTTVSDSTKATVTASSSAPNGTQKLNIIQTAQAGYLTGGKLDSSTTTGTTLAELGYTGGTGKITLTKGDGTTTSIEVSQGSTVANVIASLKDAGLTANYDDTNKRIFVSSSSTGKDNDFTLTGGNVDGVNALYKLGLNVGSDATTATYTSYTKYYDADGNQLSQNVADAIANYKAAQTDYAQKTAQNTNLTAAYGYASAYSAMEAALESTNLSTSQKQQLTQLLSMTATERTQSVMTADGTLYKEAGTDASGNTIYKSDAGNYIQRVNTYTGSDGNTYKLNSDGNYELNGVVYKDSGTTDADGKTLYKSDDGNEITITTTSAYYAATASERNTGFSKYTDDAGNTYTQNDTGTYQGADGNTYKLSASASGNKMILLDSSGNETSTEVAVGSAEAITETTYTQGASLSGVDRSVERLVDLKSAIQTNMGSTDEELDTFINTLTSNVTTVKEYEAGVDTVLSGTDSYSRADISQKIKDAYASGGADAVTALTNTFAQMITNNRSR
jgi:flagellar hook-associated protein 2